jgi:WD40 repeat protein
MPVNIFFCYAHSDEQLLNRLKGQLTPFASQGLITMWHDREIDAGAEWEKEIHQKLDEAHIILLLLSSAFMQSKYCYGEEMQRALERHKKREARIIPIILRPVYWHDVEVLQGLLVLPKDAKPVTDWSNREKAFYDVAKSIRKVVDELASEGGAASAKGTEPYQPVTVASGGLPSQKNAFERKSLHRILRGHTDAVKSLIIRSDGKTLVSASADTTIKLWNLDTGQCLNTLTGHNSSIESIAITPDREMLVSASADTTIKLWSLATGKCLNTLDKHTKTIRSIAINPDDRRLVSGSADGTIRFWDLVRGQELNVLEGYTGRIMVISPDGKTLVTGGENGSVYLWDLATEKIINALSSPTGIIKSVVISPDGKTLVSGHSSGKIKLWVLSQSTAQEMRTLPGHKDVIVSITISLDGKKLASGDGNGTIKLWNLSTNQEMHNLTGHQRAILCLSFSPDGRTLVSGGLDGTIRVWNV